MAGPSASGHVLVVDDDAAVAWTLEQALGLGGYRVTVSADARAAQRQLGRERPDLVITDVRMPGRSGLDLLADLRASHPDLPVVVMTAYGTVDTAVEAVRRGAADYLAKPLDLDRIQQVVARILGDRALAMRVPCEAGDEQGAPELVGACPAMQEAFRSLAAAAVSEACVLIRGPGGSGKELAARVLHSRSGRAAGPLLHLDCQALAEDTPAAAIVQRLGALAAGAPALPGMLLLDEVAELPPAGQAWLMEALSGASGLGVDGRDLRVVATTARDLEALAAGGDFRADLAGRLRVIAIDLPPLAQRAGDVPLLVRHLLRRLVRREGRALALTEPALARLVAHAWPGEVRELATRLEAAAAFARDGIIDREHLQLPDAPAGDPQWRQAVAALARERLHGHPGHAWRHFTGDCEGVLLREAMALTRGNQLRAAALLGLNRMTLRRRLGAEGGAAGDGRRP